MKTLTLILLSFLVACATTKEKEVLEMRVTPVVLNIITKEIKNESSTLSGRYTVKAKVMSPERFKEKEIFLVLDGVPPHCDFLKIDEQWTIDFDESSFHSIEYAGLSFWKYSDLKPRKIN